MIAKYLIVRYLAIFVLIKRYIVLKDAVPYSFEITSDGHAKDSKQEYYEGKPVAGSTGSLENLGDGYTKDEYKVFYNGKEISLTV